MTGPADGLPLGGVRVLDLSRYIAGPYCASVLADLGAEVVRVEPPGGGDDRDLVPVGLERAGALFLQMNRNKKSVALDGRTARGRELLERLIASVAVVVTSLPVPELRRQGLDRAALVRLRPDLVTANVSAFGAKGRLSCRGGFDAVGQAMSGAAYLSGRAGAPMRSAASYVDYGTGLGAAVGVLAALLEKTRTGEGQDVQASLLGTALSFLNPALIEEAVLGRSRRPYGNRSPNSGPSDVYPTADGAVVVQVVGSRMFARWAKLVGRPELARDPRFRTDADRGRNGQALSRIMRAWTRERISAEALKAMNAAGIPAAPVHAPGQVLADPAVAETGLLTGVPFPGLATPAPLAETIVRLNDRTGMIRSRAPLLGEHTIEVLTALGLGRGEIDDLLARGTISAAPAQPAPDGDAA